MKDTILVIAVAVEIFSGIKLFEVHCAFRFNVISGFKNCHYKSICLLLSFEICCERQKGSGKNLKFDFPPVIQRATIMIPRAKRSTPSLLTKEGARLFLG